MPLSLALSRSLVAALGGGAPTVPASYTSEYFANTGATYPWYGNATTPSAICVSATNTTWFAWEGFDGTQKVIYVATYKHTQLRWTTPVVVAVSPLQTDDHGVPSLCRDHEGYVHCFFGGHNTPIHHSVTSTPDNPSSWSSQPVFDEAATYPRPTLIGSTLYCFQRSSTNQVYLLYKTTALSGGVATWGPAKHFGDFGSGTRWYSSDHVPVAGRIHMLATRANSSDAWRRDVYYLTYDPVADSIANIDGSVNTSVASSPIDLTTLDASYKIVSQPTPTGSGDIPALCFDGSTPHVLYSDGALGDVCTVYHIAYESAAWTSPHTLGTTVSKDSAFAVVPKLGGGVTAYWTQNAGFTSGGHMYSAARSSGGSWGSSTQLRAATVFALNDPSQVRDGHPNARVIIPEVWDIPDLPNGTLRTWVQGDSGPLMAPALVDTIKWNNNNGNSALVLSGGGLIVTSAAAAIWQISATRGVGVGEKKYWEIVVSAFTTAADWAAGIGNDLCIAGTLDGSGFLGNNTRSIAHRANGDNIRNNSTVSNTGAVVAGDILCFAADKVAGKLWIRKNNGNWNNDVVANQNPVTADGGFGVGGTAGGWFPMVQLSHVGDQATAKFTAASWTYTAPSGFLAI